MPPIGFRPAYCECFVCKRVTGTTGNKRTGERYYRAHHNPATGRQCLGSGRSPGPEQREATPPTLTGRYGKIDARRQGGPR